MVPPNKQGYGDDQDEERYDDGHVVRVHLESFRSFRYIMVLQIEATMESITNPIRVMTPSTAMG